MSSDEGSAVVRLARAEDVGAILDLLTEYDRPRAYFEPYYLHDPSYLPEQSLVVERAGRLLAHLRIFDRTLRMQGTPLRIAGVGNVITSRVARGRGYAGQLLQQVVVVARELGYVYSLLWTHLPDLYAGYGWAPLGQAFVQTELTAPAGTEAAEGTHTIAEFAPADLPAVMRLYDAFNANRTGTVIRSPEYWQGQLAWLQAGRPGFLVCRDTAGVLVGYVRSRVSAGVTEILELGAPADRIAVARMLVGAAAASTEGRLRAHLPSSLYGALAPQAHEIVLESGLMGRVLNLPALVRMLASRMSECGAAGVLQLATSAGAATVQVDADEMTLERATGSAQDDPLGEAALAHLLFHGFDSEAGDLLGDRTDAALLKRLFPAQDFVLWPADDF